MVSVGQLSVDQLALVILLVLAFSALRAKTTHRLTISYQRARPSRASASLVELVAAGVQDYFAVPDFSVGDTILIGVLNHVTS